MSEELREDVAAAPDALCVIVSTWPAISTTAVRTALGLATKVGDTTPVPAPLWPGFTNGALERTW